MKKTLLSVFTCFFFLPLFATDVSGIVTDIADRPLPYASIFVKETNKGTNANSEGKYILHLTPGKYTIVCQHVGYARQEKIIEVESAEIKIDFQLEVQELTLEEVIIKKGEDPAYEIIRQTIAQRSYHLEQLNKFKCRVYTKGLLRLRDFPKKIFGQKVDFEDGDTSKQKILYLSEVLANYAADKPNKERIDVISSRVSGQSDGFGLSVPQFFSFYENNISIGDNINPRGFVSPIADNALNFYNYKLEGTYYEDGHAINHIKVLPKRQFEPLFTGYIDIVDDEWRIHSLKLGLTKASQMQLLDTLKVEQLFRPVTKDVAFVSSQVIYPAVKFLGFDAYGSFINLYDEVEINPVFPPKTFNSTILKYSDSANKKSKEYWETVRPIPLMQVEQADFERKDSLEIVRKNPHYMDSIDKKRNKVSWQGLLLTGQTFSNTRKRSTFHIPSLIERVVFNPAEGWVINTEMDWTKRLDTSSAGRRAISISPVLRYGFANQHFNAYLTGNYTFGKKFASNIYLSGGKRVFQFNSNSPITELGNTISCLFSEENRIKSYEARYVRGSFRQQAGHGLSWVVAFQYQDRLPLDNSTDFSWHNKVGVSYTPNYPFEISNQNIVQHQVFTTVVGIKWQPGSRYMELPNRIINLGSRLPVFEFQFTKGYKNFFGSDADFNKWKLNMSDDVNLKLKGSLKYRLGVGGFLSSANVPLPDYNHFNGNISILATEYLNSFQLLPIYQFSNTSNLYGLTHVEYNLKGFLTNKIPVIRKLNFYLVTGANGFFINNNKNYYEWFVGIDNIFKILRIDYVRSYQQGKSWQSGFRFGFSKIVAGKRGDDWP